MTQTTREKVNNLVLQIIREVLNSDDLSNRPNLAIPSKGGPLIGPGNPGGAKIFRDALVLKSASQQDETSPSPSAVDTAAADYIAALGDRATGTHFTMQDVEKNINRFTGNDDYKRRTFLISFLEADRLVSQDGKELALRVIYMDDPDKLEASWVAFDEETAKKDGNLVSYFVLKKKFFGPEARGDKNNFRSRSKGISTITDDDYYFYYDLMITARIGRNEDDSNSVYFIVGKIDYITSPGGDNPMGATTGAKIPPG